MPEQQHQTLRYRILRYTPNLIRDEWINIGVLLEEVPPASGGNSAAPHRAIRLVEEPSEFARLRRLHPSADETLLRALAPEFEQRLRGDESQIAAYLSRLDQTLSNALQLSPQRAVLAENFDVEMERLYHEHVAVPSRARGGVMQNTKQWIRSRLNDIFRRRRILDKMEHPVHIEEFTQPGDPFRIDYSYRYNGTRGFLHAIPLARDYSQAKIFAYTAECIRARAAHVEFSAITEAAPSPKNPRHHFIMRLFEDQRISILPLSHVEAFAESLRPRLR